MLWHPLVAVPGQDNFPHFWTCLNSYYREIIGIYRPNSNNWRHEQTFLFPFFPTLFSKYNISIIEGQPNSFKKCESIVLDHTLLKKHDNADYSASMKEVYLTWFRSIEYMLSRFGAFRKCKRQLGLLRLCGWNFAFNDIHFEEMANYNWIFLISVIVILLNHTMIVKHILWSIRNILVSVFI